jgi:hypothetical protein
VSLKTDSTFKITIETKFNNDQNHGCNAMQDIYLKLFFLSNATFHTLKSAINSYSSSFPMIIYYINITLVILTNLPPSRLNSLLYFPSNNNNVCGRERDGFTYHCEQCEFNADVQRSLIPDIVSREGHEHQLILLRAPYNEKCSCCDHEGRVFRYADCEFTLDVRCTCYTSGYPELLRFP